jgi:hypothetical protein
MIRIAAEHPAHGIVEGGIRSRLRSRVTRAQELMTPTLFATITVARSTSSMPGAPELISRRSLR